MTTQTASDRARKLTTLLDKEKKLKEKKIGAEKEIELLKRQYNEHLSKLKELGISSVDDLREKIDEKRAELDRGIAQVERALSDIESKLGNGKC